MNIKLKQQKRPPHLIKLDIDGTSTNQDYSTLNQRLKKLLFKLKEDKHKICFTTGRNYLSALPFYKEVGLNTFLVTYNGAYIVNPSKASSAVVVNPISNEIIKRIIKEPVIKNNLINTLIDRIDLTTLSTSDDIYYQKIFFNGNPYLKGDVMKLLGDQDALQLVLEFNFSRELFNRIITTLRNKYGDAISFYTTTKFKSAVEGNEETALITDSSKMIFKIRNRFASKGMGARWASTYHNIALSKTIAFGNDDNDIELISTVGVGIATADSSMYLKYLAYGTTEFDLLNSDGVTNYLASHFGYTEIDNDFHFVGWESIAEEETPPAA